MHFSLSFSLRIGWAEGKNVPKPMPVMPEPKTVETAQVHVSFISKQIDVLISEATLRALFGLYGEVLDVALKKSQFDRVSFETFIFLSQCFAER
jgi:hypothetical protein